MFTNLFYQFFLQQQLDRTLLPPIEWQITIKFRHHEQLISEIDDHVHYVRVSLWRPLVSHVTVSLLQNSGQEQIIYQ